MSTNIRNSPSPHRSAVTATALLALLLLAGCVADPEKARYINNDRIIGNYTESEVGQATRTTAGAAAVVGAFFFFEWLEHLMCHGHD